MSEGHFERPLCGYRGPRHLPPGLKSLRHLLAVHAGWEAVTPRTEVLGNRTVGSEKALRVAWDLNRCIAAPVGVSAGGSSPLDY